MDASKTAASPPTIHGSPTLPPRAASTSSTTVSTLDGKGRDIRRLSAPLSIYDRTGINFNFQQAQHWAIEVGGVYYEISHGPLSNPPGKIKLYYLSSSEWTERYQSSKWPPIGVLAGKTNLSDDQLQKEATSIWKDDFHERYSNQQNCQRFAQKFFRRILVSPGDPELSQDVLESWVKIPQTLGDSQADITKAMIVAASIKLGIGLACVPLDGGVTAGAFGAALGALVAKRRRDRKTDERERKEEYQERLPQKMI